MVQKEIDLAAAEAMQRTIRGLEAEGRVSRTFRRLDPDRQQAVIDAIIQEAAENGPGGINVKRVAGRAGVAVGSLYQYFGNRERLLGFAVEVSVKAMSALFDESRAYLTTAPLRDALSSYLSYGIEWGDTQSGFLRLFGKAAYSGDPDMADPLVRPIASLMKAMVKDLLTAAAARGEIRSDIDLDAAASALNVLLIGVGDAALMPHINGYFRVIDEATPIKRVITAVVDLVLRGIGVA